MVSIFGIGYIIYQLVLISISIILTIWKKLIEIDSFTIAADWGMATIFEFNVVDICLFNILNKRWKCGWLSRDRESRDSLYERGWVCGVLISTSDMSVDVVYE